MASSPKIDELRKKFEENPRRYFAPLAHEYRKAGDTEQAIAICREYLPQQPGHMSGHIVFGQALFEAKQLDEAKTVFETALSLDPENLIALRHLGDITLAAGDKEAATGWYRRVLDADPRNEETQAILAQIEPKPAAAPIATPATPAQATPTSKTMPMPAAKPSAASSAPTVVMQAMRPLPKLGATHVPAAPAAPAAAAPPSASGSASAAADAPAPPAAPTPVAPIPSLSTAPTVPLKVPAVPSEPAPTEEIRLEGLTHGADSAAKVAAGSSSLPATLIMETPHGLAPATETPAVAPAMGLETTAVASNDAPIDSFSLDGLETTSLAASTPPPAPPAQPIELDVVAAVPAPEAPPATPPIAAPVIELDLPPAAAPAALPAIDLDFAAAAPAAAPEPPPAMPPAPAEDAGGLVDLEIDIPAAPAPAAPEVQAAPAPAPAPSPSPTTEPGAVAATVTAPAPEATAPEFAPLEIELPASAPESGPFVTETMAELYLKQGHRDEALRVYRALQEQRPGDATISAKISELSNQPPADAAPVAPPVASSAPPAPALPPSQGPTIRSLLVLIAMRRPGYRPEVARENGAGVAPATNGSASAHGVDVLASLWNGAAPSPDEESAALVLSAAFADLRGDSHASGALDLSGAAAAAMAERAAAAAALASGAPAAPSSFSFDKFFSQRVTAEHAAQVAREGASGAPAESREDVAKFTQWLEGLKQR